MNISLEDYLIEIETKNYSKLTVKNKKAIILQYERYIIDTYQTTLEDATGRMFKRWIKHLLDTGIKANTINTKLKTIRNFYRYMLDEKIIKENPVEEFDFLKEEKPMIKPFTLKEIEKMLGYYVGSNFIDVRNKAVLTCLFETGIRSNEIASITLADVFEDSILIRGKGNKQRLVPISLQLNKQLRRYRRARDKYLADTRYKGHHQPCDYLFVCTRSNGGDKPSTKEWGKMGHDALLNVVKRAGKAVDVDCKLLVHSCRRSFAVHMLDHIDFYSLSKLLGHADIKTTTLYVASTADEKLLDRGRVGILSGMGKSR